MQELLPTLLGIAWLVPLASFTVIVFLGPKLGKHGYLASWVATGAILTALALSMVSLGIWLKSTGGVAPAEHAAAHDASVKDKPHGDAHSDHAAHHVTVPESLTGEWYTLGQFGKLRVTISYYIDSLTIGMFAMVTLIATCIHFYAIGYMHDELHEITDREVLVTKGHKHGPAKAHAHGHDSHGHDAHGHGSHGHEDHGHDSHGHDAHGAHGHGHDDGPAPPAGKEFLHRPGRFHRFFQYLSLFCFSMLGIVIAGNIAMVFVFWELVGICSYFLIGFYIERKSASTAANKAFIVNRVGDFGMIIGLMALFGSLGTFAFGDVDANADGKIAVEERGVFSLVRSPENDHALIPPDGMVMADAADKVARIVADHANDTELAMSEIESELPDWRDGKSSTIGPEGQREPDTKRYGYWLLFIAGVGIFCGCVGKSAQFPLHTWLPDAMEGPTPVSALVHSATMVAAGVYLVGRFYPVFTPDVLLVIAYIGTITLFLAATIAITATDIKRVLAYSTVSQLGYMMLALGVGGWVAGLFHLITHAFFKSLLFMCSGSVIHACHTNEMTSMGGLRHKMPYTAYSMLVGCLAIIGAGVPFVIGFSGYYSKDAIIAQALSFWHNNPTHGAVFFLAAAGGASITAFYMFRLWYMTFAGPPRDQKIYDHAHESPKIMYAPLVFLAVFALGVGWTLPNWSFMGPFRALGVANLLEQARPATSIYRAHFDHDEKLLDERNLATRIAALEHDGLVASGQFAAVHYISESASHLNRFHVPATIIAFSTAAAGFVLATVFYGLRILNPEEVRQQFSAIYVFLRNKWYFDELYNAIFVRPTFFISNLAARFDKQVIDGLIDNIARGTKKIAKFDDFLDRYFIDGLVNVTAHWTFSIGKSLRSVQTGKLRQYVMLIVIGTVALTVLIKWSVAAGP